MIRVSEPLLKGNEKKYLCQAIDEGEVSSGGKFVERFEEAFAKWSGNKYAISVCNGTAALEVATWAMGIHEIDIPCGTIISCFLGPDRAGSRVLLHDNEEIVGETIMRCHLFGSFDSSIGNVVVDDLSQFWQPFNVQDVGCYSLYANKLITSGEGGIIVTNRKDVYERAKYYRNICHSEERFIHYDLGYNFRFSNIQAAVALAQLEQIDKFSDIKRRNRDLYFRYMPGKVTSFFNVKVPWMYLIKTQKPAQDVCEEMNRQGIECRRFFYPLHRQPCLSRVKSSFPIADDLWNHAFYLPSGLNLTEKDIVNVCSTLFKVLRSV